MRVIVDKKRYRPTTICCSVERARTAASPVNLSLSQLATARPKTSEIRTLDNWPKLRSLIDKAVATIEAAGSAILNEFAVIHPDALTEPLPNHSDFVANAGRRSIGL